MLSGSLLTAAHNNAVTTLAVDDGTDFAVGNFISVNKEIMEVTAISSNNLTVTRGARGTTAAAHADDDPVRTYGDGGQGEVMVLRNCYVTEHAVTLQVDGSQEETMTLMSYTDPKIYDGITGGEWDDATTVAEL